MRKWIDIVDEAAMDRIWDRRTINAIDGRAQERFEIFRQDRNFRVIGSIKDNSGVEYSVWSDPDEIGETRFYAGNLEDRCVGFLALRDLKPGMQYVTMTFVRPNMQKRGIAKALYMFALEHRYVIVSDNTLTKGSRAIWQSMMHDPRVDVTYFSYDRYSNDKAEEKPLDSIRKVFSVRDRRMVARLKSLVEYREQGLSTFTHDDHRYNLNKLFGLTEDLPVERFKVADLIWVLDYDDPDPERTKTADLAQPILITRAMEDGENKLVVVDGLHRLAKAKSLGKNYISGKMVSRQMLERCDLTIFVAHMRKRLSRFLKEDQAFAIPTVWYHSTEEDPRLVANDFADHNLDPTGVAPSNEFWFSDSWSASRYYGPNTVVARLNFHNPLLVTSEDFKKSRGGPSSYWAKKARQAGYDAVVIHDILDGDEMSTVCAVFDPSIIDARPYAEWDEDTQDFTML